MKPIHPVHPTHPPHPKAQSVRVALVYKNFAASTNVSHIGLGVAGLNNQKSLQAAGIPAEVWAINTPQELEARLTQETFASRMSYAVAPLQPVTHVIISAPWIPTEFLQKWSQQFHDATFAVNCHSNVGFLQADANGVKLMREAMELEEGVHNFHFAGNSQKFCDWIGIAYGDPCAYLPNLYYLQDSQPIARPTYNGGTLRVGVFGATRPQKNFVSAIGAALTISRELKADTEVWVSAGRTEGGGLTILSAAREMLRGLPHVKLVESAWSSWPKFREIVANMHLLLQPSYTESFNMVTADGVAMGVPSAVSDAIDWAPDHWKAKSDDVQDIARVGRLLLHDAKAVSDGAKALRQHNASGLRAWLHFLGLL